jgi:hypothetical protein
MAKLKKRKVVYLVDDYLEDTDGTPNPRVFYHRAEALKVAGQLSEQHGHPMDVTEVVIEDS